jgi:isoleucyl-tRNA synthetase
MEGSLVDIIGSVSTVTYSHKVTKEKIIMRSLPQIFTKVEAVDFEPFEERLDRITRNYQDKGSQVFADYKRIIAAKAKGWCLTSKQAWGIPAPVLSIVDREGFTSMAKELDIVATGSLFTCKEFIDHCRFLFLEHSHEIWWEWSVQALLPERLKPLAPFLAKDTSLVFDQQFVQGCSWLTLLPPSTATKSTEISKQRLLYPCTLAFEGKDQNETWLFSTSMTSRNDSN